MSITNRKAGDLFTTFSLRGEYFRERRSNIVRSALFLTGMALAVVLGLMVALSTTAFAMGGGGGGGPASASKVTKVDDPVGKLKDEVVTATVGFAASTSSVVEDDGRSHLVEVQISEPLSQLVTLNVVAGGTAIQGTDYVISPTLTIPAGATSAFLTLMGIDDDDDVAEEDETVTLTLAVHALPDGVSFGKRTHTVTIVNVVDEVEIAKRLGEETPKTAVKPGDETDTDAEDKTVSNLDFAMATAEFAASSPVEAREGEIVHLIFTLSRYFPQEVTLSLHGSVVGTVSAGDFVLPRTVTFPRETTTATVALAVLDDDVAEADETIVLTLTGELLPDGVVVGTKSTHAVTVLANDQDTGVVKKPEEKTPEVVVNPGDDDAPVAAEIGTKPDEGTTELPEPEVVERAVVGFKTRFSEATEGDVVKIPVILSSPLPQTITLSVEVSGSTSIGKDIAPLPSAVVFPQGKTTAFINFTVVDDSVVEFDETITLSLWKSEELRALPGGPYVKRIYPRAHHLTITDNDNNLDEQVPPDPELTFSIENLGIVDYISNGKSYIFGDVLIKNAIQGTVDRSIYAYHDGSGKISIENWGTIGGDVVATHRSNGEISIENRGAVGGFVRTTHRGNGEISIENLGSVDNDINVVSHSSKELGSSDISIKNALQGTVGANISAYHYGNGEVSIKNHGTVNRDIIADLSGNGGVSIENHGTVNSAMQADHSGNGGISITNHGTVDRMKVTREGNGRISIANHGTVDRMKVRHFGDGEVLIVNQGVAGEMRAHHYGDNGILRFSGNIRGEWNELAGELVYVGDVVFNGDEYSELKIIGDYNASSDTQLSFYVDSNGWGRDRLVIEGDVTGQSLVSLIMPDTPLSSVTANSKTLIEVDGKAQADDFVGEETVGAYHYVLEYVEGYTYHKWRFINQGLSDAAKKTSQIADELSDSIEKPPTNDPDKKPELGLWGEQNGSNATVGLNALATRLMGGDMVVGTSMSRNFSTSNNVSVDSQITALAASWERNGFYAGGQTRYARFTSDVSTDRLSVVQDNEGTGVNASVNLGYRFAFPLGGVDFQVAPQMQLVWSRVNFDDFVGPHGERVSLEDGDLTTGRLGLSWDGEWQGAEGFGRIYGGVNLREAVDGRTSVSVSGVSLASKQGLSVDGKLGLSYEWDEGYSVYGEASALHRDDADEVRANLGVRIDF